MNTNTNIERIEATNTVNTNTQNVVISHDLKEQLPQTEASLIALLFNRIEEYQKTLNEQEDKISHLREQLNESRKDLLAYKVGIRRTLDVANELAKLKRELEDQINRIQQYWS